MSDLRPWWQDGVIYQIVVPSFLDTNGDGLGDLPGVLQRLEYLEWLGVETIWLSPIYPSPLADLGYDIADFTAIHPRFGTFNDFDLLLQECHRRGMKLLLDWVPNHTSTEHAWFQESISSRGNPKRDWYIWRDPRRDGSVPTNWVSMFGGGAWQWHEPTGQYYLHTFLDQQADLNWRNPEVWEAMFDTLRFWLDRGVDGFRIDAIDLLLKDDQFRDNPPNPDWQEGEPYANKLFTKYTRNQPGIHDLVAKMRKVADEYDGDRMLCGELYVPVHELVEYYGKDQPELHMPLNLEIAWVDWSDDEMVRIIEEYYRDLPRGAWPTWTLSTHDNARLAARVHGEQTRVAAMLLLTLGGTPTHYYGEEIGMRGVPIPPEQAIDPQGRLSGRNRDPERTPMQWNNETYAGFSTAEPWLPIGDDLSRVNVAAQMDDPRSLLSLYRRLIALRKEKRVLIEGGHQMIARKDPILAYRRTNTTESIVVVLNPTDDPHSFRHESLEATRILLSSYLDREGENADGQVQLRADEALILVPR